MRYILRILLKNYVIYKTEILLKYYVVLRFLRICQSTYANDVFILLGMIVAGLARRVEKIKEIADTLEDSSGKLHPIECDVTKEQSVIAAFAWIKNNLGPIGVLVNSAGITKESSLIGENC